HVCTDGQGVPLSLELTAANVNDGTRLVALIDGIPPIAGQRGRPRQRPLRAQGDRAYESAANREAVRALGIEPVLARSRTDHGIGLGVTLWSSSARTAGFTSSGGCACASSAWPRSTKRSSGSAPA